MRSPYGTTPLAGCEDPTLPFGASPDDCDDADAAVHPDAAEQPCDGSDQDCDGLLEEVATVEGAASYATIQAAIEAAPNGSTIWICDGTWTERLEVAEDQELRVAGWSGDASLVVLDGQELFPILIADEGADLTLEDLTFTRGYGFLDEDPTADFPVLVGGAVTIHSGSLAARRVSFVDNRSVAAGGAVQLSQQTADLEVSSFEDCIFSNNHADPSVIDWRGEPLELSPQGGSISFEPQGEARLTIERCAFSGGTARSGGEVNLSAFKYSDEAFDVAVEISASTFSGSSATYEGGAILGDVDGGTIDITDVHVEGCAAENGGAISIAETMVTITDVVVSDSSAKTGGCVILQSNWSAIDATITNSTFSRCSAVDGSGGAIAVSGWGDSVVHMENTVIEDSISDYRGGGLYLSARGTAALTIKDSHFEDNRTRYMGGGVYLNGSLLDAPLVAQIENTVFHGNVADDDEAPRGAGLHLFTNAELTVTDCDFGEDADDNVPNDFGIYYDTLGGLGAHMSFTCAADDTCVGLP